MQEVFQIESLFREVCNGKPIEECLSILKNFFSEASLKKHFVLPAQRRTGPDDDITTEDLDALKTAQLIITIFDATLNREGVATIEGRRLIRTLQAPLAPTVAKVLATYLRECVDRGKAALSATSEDGDDDVFSPIRINTLISNKTEEKSRLNSGATKEQQYFLWSPCLMATQALLLIASNYELTRPFRNATWDALQGFLARHLALASKYGIRLAHVAETEKSILIHSSSNTPSADALRELRESHYACYLLSLTILVMLNSCKVVIGTSPETIEEEPDAWTDTDVKEEITKESTLRNKLHEIYDRNLDLARTVDGFIAIIQLGVGLIPPAESNSSRSNYSLIYIIKAFRGGRGQNNVLNFVSSETKSTEDFLRGKVAKRLIQLIPPAEALVLHPSVIPKLYYDIANQILSHDLIEAMFQIREYDVSSYKAFSATVQRNKEIAELERQRQMSVGIYSGMNVGRSGKTMVGGGGGVSKYDSKTVTLPFTSSMAHLCNFIAYILKMLPDSTLTEEGDARQDGSIAIFLFANMRLHIRNIATEVGVKTFDFSGSLPGGSKVDFWEPYFVKLTTAYLGALASVAMLSPQYAARMYHLTCEVVGSDSACELVEWRSVISQLAYGMDATEQNKAGTVQGLHYTRPGFAHYDSFRGEGDSCDEVRLMTQRAFQKQCSKEYRDIWYNKYFSTVLNFINNIMWCAPPAEAVFPQILSGDLLVSFFTNKCLSPTSLGDLLRSIACLVSTEDELFDFYSELCRRGVMSVAQRRVDLVEGPSMLSGRSQKGSVPTLALLESASGEYPITRGILNFVIMALRYIKQGRDLSKSKFLGSPDFRALITFVSEDIIPSVHRYAFTNTAELHEVQILCSSYLFEALALCSPNSALFATGLMPMKETTSSIAVVPAATSSAPLSTKLEICDIMALSRAPSDCLQLLLGILEDAVIDSKLVHLTPLRVLAVRIALKALSAAMSIQCTNPLINYSFNGRTYDSFQLVITLLELVTLQIGFDEVVARRALIILISMDSSTCNSAAQSLYNTSSTGQRIATNYAQLIVLAKSGAASDKEALNVDPMLMCLDRDPPGKFDPDPSVARLALDLLIRNAPYAPPSLTSFLCGYSDPGTNHGAISYHGYCLEAIFSCANDLKFSSATSTAILGAKCIQIIYLLLYNDTTSTRSFFDILHQPNNFNYVEMMHIIPKISFVSVPNPSAIGDVDAEDLKGINPLDRCSTEANAGAMHIIHYCAYVMKALAVYFYKMEQHQQQQPDTSDSETVMWGESIKGNNQVLKRMLDVLIDKRSDTYFHDENVSEHRSLTGSFCRHLTATLASLPKFPSVTNPVNASNIYVYNRVDVVPQYNVTFLFSLFRSTHPNHSLQMIAERLRIYVYANSCLLAYHAASDFAAGWAQLLAVVCSLNHFTVPHMIMMCEVLVNALQYTTKLTTATEEAIIKSIGDALCSLVLKLSETISKDYSSNNKEAQQSLHDLIGNVVLALVRFGQIATQIRQHFYVVLRCLLEISSYVPIALLIDQRDALLNMIVEDISLSHIIADMSPGSCETYELDALNCLRCLLCVSGLCEAFAISNVSGARKRLCNETGNNGEDPYVNDSTSLILALEKQEAIEELHSHNLALASCSHSMFTLVCIFAAVLDRSIARMLATGDEGCAVFALEYAEPVGDVLSLLALTTPHQLYYANVVSVFNKMTTWGAVRRVFGDNTPSLKNRMIKDVVKLIITSVLRWMSTLISTFVMRSHTKLMNEVFQFITDNLEVLQAMMKDPLRSRFTEDNTPVVTTTDLEATELCSLLVYNLSCSTLSQQCKSLIKNLYITDVLTAYTDAKLLVTPMFVNDSNASCNVGRTRANPTLPLLEDRGYIARTVRNLSAALRYLVLPLEELQVVEEVRKIEKLPKLESKTLDSNKNGNFVKLPEGGIKLSSDAEYGSTFSTLFGGQPFTAAEMWPLMESSFLSSLTIITGQTAAAAATSISWENHRCGQSFVITATTESAELQNATTASSVYLQALAPLVQMLHAAILFIQLHRETQPHCFLVTSRTTESSTLNQTEADGQRAAVAFVHISSIRGSLSYSLSVLTEVVSHGLPAGAQLNLISLLKAHQVHQDSLLRLGGGGKILSSIPTDDVVVTDSPTDTSSSTAVQLCVYYEVQRVRSLLIAAYRDSQKQ